MMSLKPSFKGNLGTDIGLAALVAVFVYKDFGYEMTLISGTDGNHACGSKHGIGDAIDVCVDHIPQSRWSALADAIRDRLNDDYDVVLRFDPSRIHIEYDPQPKRLGA